MYFDFESLTSQPSNAFERELLQMERTRHRSVLSQLKHELREKQESRDHARDHRHRSRNSDHASDVSTAPRRREDSKRDEGNRDRGRDQ